ncbi:DUF5615 family PIN-like protein [Microcoleus sp. Pol14C6]|uniref:DUF5615 family PIN-like protein n=1 Tax=unclassified Microcoleus TaxID=2642155 RepID=UPI003B1AE5E9
MTNTDDAEIWEYAKTNNFVIVSKDSDFHQRSLLYGHTPKFIYLRVGNCSTSKIVQMLQDEIHIISQFGDREQRVYWYFCSMEPKEQRLRSY